MNGKDPFERFNKLIKKAQRTNRKRDRMERKVGAAAPSDCPPDVHFSTAMEAIKAGMIVEDWDAVAEGYVMLREFSKRVKTYRVVGSKD